MARPIVLSNGELHVGLNNYGLVHDLYFPYVGLENHAAGANMRHKIGIWCDGQISWLDEDKGWAFSFSYPHDSLIGHIVAENKEFGVILEFDDTVDSSVSAFLRSIHVINSTDSPKSVRLFMHQAFAIGDSRSNTDTAQYLPDSDAVLHYRGRRAFVISGKSDGKPFDQQTVGLFGIENHEGTYKDAEDGELSNCVVEHGRVDSTIRFCLDLEPHGSKRVEYWVAAGKSIREALYVHKIIQDEGIQPRLEQTASWWYDWLEPVRNISRSAPQHLQDLFVKSAMIIKSQMDKRGAVIASTDSSLLNYSRDYYSYAWPRDGAYTVWPLIRMGYFDEPYRFFEFSKKGLNANGFLAHKYRSDGAIGSSWHPYIHEDGTVAPPIQEDETALTLFVFCQFYDTQKNRSLLHDFYEDMVVPMADFLSEYINPQTGLPKASYDLWEEVFQTTTYSTAVTYAALLAASDLAAEVNDSDNAVKWRAVASDIAENAKKHLYNDQRKMFYKGIVANEQGHVVTDETIDMSAFFGPFLYGLFPDGGEELDSSFNTILRVFSVAEKKFVPRYENDLYRRESDDIDGNFWHITSLWLAQYYIAHGQIDKAQVILSAVSQSSLSTGMLSEQINPKTNESISPAPLTWSHAEFISTVLDLIASQPEEPVI